MSRTAKRTTKSPSRPAKNPARVAAGKKSWETRRRNALRALLAGPAANAGNPELPAGWDLAAPTYEVEFSQLVVVVPPPLPTTYEVTEDMLVGCRRLPPPLPTKCPTLHRRALALAFS